MNRRQFRLCKVVLREKSLGKIQAASGVDLESLQDILSPESLTFSDYTPGKNTVVTLSDSLIDDFEAYRSARFDMFFNRSISISALLISIIALLSQIGILQLPQC